MPAVVQRETGRGLSEIERSRLDPGRVAGRYPPLSFSLYGFTISESGLKVSHQVFLDQLARLLMRDGSLSVRLAGHADSTGNAAINDPLSLQRAQAVADALTSRGAFPESPAGHGSRKAIGNNGTETGRARNRRVEVSILHGDNPVDVVTAQ